MLQKFKLFMSLSLALLFSFSMVACSDDDDNTPTIEPVISTTELSFSKDGETLRLSVRAAVEPQVTVNQTWCSVTLASASQTGIYSYNVVVEANPEAQARSAVISVVAGDFSASVQVSQESADYVSLVDASQAQITVGADGADYVIKLTASAQPEVQNPVEWIVIDDEPTLNDDGSYSFALAVRRNMFAAERSATLTFVNGATKVEVVISQAAGSDAVISAKAMDIAPLMVPGWNLGNTMEAYIAQEGEEVLYTNKVGLSGETAWQSTRTTQQIIDFVASQGFRSVRVPCNWMTGHIVDAENLAIDPEWMARVKEIVDYCINAELYVVLNDHYDGGWVEQSFENLDEAEITANIDRMKKMWTQIANAFIDYGDHLLFAGLNEPACSNQAQTDVLLRYEQAFIDAVRATGGNNAGRILIVQGPSTNIDYTNNYFDVTRLNDPAQDALMVEVHYYDPPQFSGVWENGNPFYFWGADNLVSDSPNNSSTGEEYMLGQFQKMKTKFFDKGYPVLLGEYGANWRQLDANQDAHNASIKLFHKLVVQYSMQCGIVPVVWDINVPNQQGSGGIMTVINRSGSCSVFGTYAMDGITEGAAAGVWPK